MRARARRAVLVCSLAIVGVIDVPDAARADAVERPAPTSYAGRPLADVLSEMRAGGLKLVFSSELVRIDMRVIAEPRQQAPRKMLDEMLRPHGLETRGGPNGTVLIVARARPSPARQAASPAARGNISGVVIDASSGAPIAGVIVEVHETGHSTVTGADGRFLLAGVPEGRSALFVSTIGYGLARPTVDVAAGATADVIIPLAEGTGAYAERVTVTADPVSAATRTAPAQETLRSAALQNVRGVLVDDPFRAVQALPGVAANDDFKSDFSVRGAGFDQMGLSIDGIATPWLLHSFEETSNSGSLSILNSDILDHATLSLGSYAQRDSARTGAWLDAALREGSRASTGLRLAVSGTNASVLAEGPLGTEAKGSWLFSLRRSYIDWLIRRVVPDFASSAFGFTDLTAKAVYDLTPRQQLQVLAIGGVSSLEQEGETNPNALAHAADDLGLTSVALRSTISSSLFLSQRGSVVVQRFHNTNPQGAETDGGHFREFAYRGDLTWTPRTDTILETGAQFQQQYTSRSAQQYTLAADRTSLVLRRSDAFDASGSIPSAYAHLSVGLGRWFSLMPGVRVAHNTANDETIASPWLQGRWRLSDSLDVRGGVGLYHQFPEFTQLFGPHAGHDLKSARSRQIDLAVEHAVTPTISWQATAYRRDDDRFFRQAGTEFQVVDGRVAVPLDDGPWTNALTGSSSGFELLVRRQSAAGWSGWASYGYGHTAYDDALTHEHFDGDFDQRHTVNTWLQYAISSRTSVSGKFRYGSNYPLPGYWEERDGGLFIGERRNEVRLPAYARLDVRANRVFNYEKRRLTLFVEVMNVLNRDNVRGLSPSSINVRTRRVTGYQESLFPLMPSAGFLFEF